MDGRNWAFGKLWLCLFKSYFLLLLSLLTLEYIHIYFVTWFLYEYDLKICHEVIFTDKENFLNSASVSAEVQDKCRELKRKKKKSLKEEYVREGKK